MSKKPLLNESTVRQFMKFANLGGLADKFVNEAYMQEDDMEEGRHKEGRMREEKSEEGAMRTWKRATKKAIWKRLFLPWSPWWPWVLDSEER